MAIALVQNANPAASGASVSTVVLSSTTAGNFLLAGIGLPPDNLVLSITDSSNNRWIQSSYASCADGNCEMWFARGIQGGAASIVITSTAGGVTVTGESYDSSAAYDAFTTYDGTSSTASSVTAINVSEWSGVWWVSPLDQWSQNFGTSASATPQTVAPRENGDLVVAITAMNAASISGPNGGFTALPMPSGFGTAMGYNILSGSVTPSMYWSAASPTAPTWAVAEACFLPGPAGLNPLVQFPETLVEISQLQNFQAPLYGLGMWTCVSSYVRAMDLGPLGRQHELDRIQSTTGTFTMNGRDGTFNPWNTQSFLYPNGLDPMSPIKVTAAWNGITSSEYYGYIQSLTPQIVDVLNIDIQIQAYDIFQMLSLKYLSSNNYAMAVTGGT